MIKGTTKMMCLLGDPVDHSLSPALHNELCKLNKFDGLYCAFAPERESVGDAVKGLKALGAIGFNVTYPYKETVIPYLDEIHEDARHLNAVNTVVIRNGRLIGYNTDVFGVEELMKKNGIAIAGKKVAILGTGGASRAVALALTKLGVDCIDFYSRCPKTNDFIRGLRNKCQVNMVTYKEFDNNHSIYDVIVNGTPLGMGEKKNEQAIRVKRLKDKATLVDLIYSPWETKLLTSAKENGYNIVNGYDMLYYQGLKAYELWTNIYIDYYDEIKKLLINGSEET
jgi:shikimate dehydrogenase